jgi:hypothetical protein
LDDKEASIGKNPVNSCYGINVLFLKIRGNASCDAKHGDGKFIHAEEIQKKGKKREEVQRQTVLPKR